MLEDRLLLWKFKHGSRDALAQIYEKYRTFLLTLATALLNDVNTAEDVLHDFFVSFAQSGRKIKLNGSLKWYLAICVTNRVRDRIRSMKRQVVNLEKAYSVRSEIKKPESSAICNEEMQLLRSAIDQIPYEQREVIILHARGRMRFRQIAKLQNVSIKTVQSRYRYGLDKLKTMLNSDTD